MKIGNGMWEYDRTQITLRNLVWATKKKIQGRFVGEEWEFGHEYTVSAVTDFLAVRGLVKLDLGEVLPHSLTQEDISLMILLDTCSKRLGEYDKTSPQSLPYILLK